MMGMKVTSPPEERPRQANHADSATSGQTQSWIPRAPGLLRVHEAAKREPKAQFTALLHHVDVEALLRAFVRLRRSAAPGVDGETIASYEQGLMSHLEDLHRRVHTGRYRPQPSRRTHIPKSDGGQRPLGIPALEDKIVQGAVAEVLNAVYEADFLDCSHGFRPKRNAHGALAQLEKAVMTERVNWVLDADLRSFFDTVDHGWLMRMLEHRIGDRRVLRLIESWLKAGVCEDGVWYPTEKGTPQGAGISPLLANVFLHYVLDLWVRQWSRHHAHGRMRMVRYADDHVFTFESRRDAEAFQADLKERLARFGLSLHAQKTRLIAFGRRETLRCHRQGRPKPETFNFLGFTHFCAFTRKGRVNLFRRTQKERQRAKLKELRQQMRRRMHLPVAVQSEWLRTVLLGYYRYYGLSGNSRPLETFYLAVVRYWRYVLMRRNDQREMSWSRFRRILEAFPLPRPRIRKIEDVALVS